MRARDRLAGVGVLQKDAGAHHVLHAGAERGQARRDLVEDVGRLRRRIARLTMIAAAEGDPLTTRLTAQVAGS